MHTGLNMQPPGLCVSAQGHHQLAHTSGSWRQYTRICRRGTP